MSGREFTPDFDWLKRGIENRDTPQPPAAPLAPGQSVPAEDPSLVDSSPDSHETGESESEPEAAVDAVDVSGISELPPAALNDSDGSTLILKNDQLDQEGFKEAAANSGILYPTEQFTDPGTTLDVPTASDATDAEIPVVSLPPELQDAIDEQGGEPSPGEEHSTVDALSSPGSFQPDESVEAALPDGAFEIPPPEEAEQPAPARPWPSAFSKPVEPASSSLERDTDVPQSAKTSEYPAGTPAWGDFAAPAVGAAIGGTRPSGLRESSVPPGSGIGDFSTGGGADPSTPRKKESSSGAANAGADRRRFILLGGYAAVVTLALLMFLLKDLTDWFRPHHLESLPDIPAEKVESLSYVPANMRLPKGHTIALGGHQRFGNILVEPLKITSEPAEFVHYTGDAKRKRDATAPVWKLWLKFTNVSQDQEIAPLDRRLVLRWVSKARQNWDFTNQYIADQGAKARNSPSLQLFRMPAQGDWDLKDQELGRVLKPGESYVTYLVASDEGGEQLGNQLVWRVQMRKGYSHKGNGVTTIFEVPFRKSDVASEAT